MPQCSNGIDTGCPVGGIETGRKADDEGKGDGPRDKPEGKIEEILIKDYLAATSVGIVNGEILLDLNYQEDSRAEVDMNFIVTGKGKFIEIQGTAESVPFSQEQLQVMIDMAKKGVNALIEKQKKVLGEII